MLETIKNILFSIGDFFAGIYDFIVGFVADIISVVEYCTSAVAQIPKFFEWLDPALVAIVLSAFAIVVIYKILGREG